MPIELGREGVIEFAAPAPDKTDAEFPGGFGSAGKNIFGERPRTVWRNQGKVTVVDSPTPMTPISLLRTHLTSQFGNPRLSVIAARRPAATAAENEHSGDGGTGHGSYSALKSQCGAWRIRPAGLAHLLRVHQIRCVIGVNGESLIDDIKSLRTVFQNPGMTRAGGLHFQTGTGDAFVAEKVQLKRGACLPLPPRQRQRHQDVFWRQPYISSGKRANVLFP